ncbi:MAG TPA: hypothetical protein VNB54_10830, partial [Alphaproteobacteria bacterium]|nr:hypothetical protein [Alphaproteobacteria bacterium]
MDTEWLESPRLLLRLAIRRALSGCAVLAVIALLAGVLCLAVYAVIHSAIFRVAAIVAALALIFLTDFIDLAVLVYGASFGAFDMFRDFMRES